MTKKSASLLLAALSGAGGAAWGVSLHQYLHPPLARALQRSLATALGVDESAVTVGRAELAWPARLVIDDVATGDWAATRIEVELDPWAALAGRRRISRVRARELVTELVGVGEAEASWGHGKTRLALRRVELYAANHWLGGLPFTIGEVGIEIDGGAVKRLAFAGARVAGVGELTGAATRASDGAWLVRAARPGLTATARVDGDGLLGQARLERFLLGDLPAPRGLSLGGATADGIIKLAADSDGPRAQPRLRIEGVGVDHPAISKQPLSGVHATIDGEIALAAGSLVARGLSIEIGGATVILDGSIAPDGPFDVAATLPRLSCSALLAALPRGLVPHLDGLLLDGELRGRVHVAGDIHDASDLALAVDGAVGCRARADAALGDVGSLVHADAAALLRHTVAGRLVPLSPKNPSWRSLDSLPPSVVRAFLVAEDGHFFAHHGFDVERIGRALAADLDAQRFDRGASTITQQVAKNLWLGGERTLGRKLEEAVLAWRLEQVLDKRRILELYLNLVELGPGVFGVQDASEKYFGKIPDELSSDEAAQLAALLPAPRRGMDAAWQKRYRALAARMPSERVTMPPPPAPVTPIKLTRR
ncbi:MAG: glycosyl transferase family 51 [Myxococcales bacterium]|nr:glycosyl transferase family 51 [Myxococcales bacterium]